jgi:addiction module HigA family antidote
MAMKNPPHPGLHVKDEIEALKLSVSQAAGSLGVTRSQLHRLIAGESAISAEMALRLETVVGGSADMWLRLQAAYSVAQVRKKAGEITKGLSRLAVPA